MIQETKIPKAIALMSGGLDSTLAAKLILDQGVQVTGLHLASPFGCLTDVKTNAAAIGVPLIIKEKGEAFLDLVKNPRFGYGRNMNPCIDCRVFMFELAELVREEQGADFIITGEVLGQRPMSQQRRAMVKIDKESDMRGAVLRRLSAKLFAPTVAEEKGWVKREDLLAISGRSRKAQLELAASFGIKNFEPPGGGCLLTEASFSGRLRDYFEVENVTGEARLARSSLLRHGRYLKVAENIRLIVGRHEQENKVLNQEWRRAEAAHFKPENFQGPEAIAFGPVTDDLYQTIGGILARYGKPNEAQNRIEFQTLDNQGTFELRTVLPENTVREMIV
ncbi:MAG: hypothetical protein KDD51_09805 [Bdellovibrionales bacterium]|nr:hypothetical protein [Bdellovibrionales bacterium]